MIATCAQHISCQSEVLFKKIEQKYKANIPPKKYDISGISIYFILAVLIDKTSDSFGKCINKIGQWNCKESLVSWCLEINL